MKHFQEHIHKMIMHRFCGAEGAGDLNKILITVGSVTYAQKAKKILNANNIASKLIKIDSSLSEKGCTHGIEINYTDFLWVVNELRKYSIPYNVIN